MNAVGLLSYIFYDKDNYDPLEIYRLVYAANIPYRYEYSIPFSSSTTKSYKINLLITPTGSRLSYKNMVAYTSDYSYEIPTNSSPVSYTDLFKNEEIGEIKSYEVYKEEYGDVVTMCPLGAFGYIIYRQVSETPFDQFDITPTDFGILYHTLIQQQNLSYLFTADNTK